MMYPHHIKNCHLYHFSSVVSLEFILINMQQCFKFNHFRDTLLVLGTAFFLIEMFYFVKQVKRNIREEGEFEHIFSRIGISPRDLWVIQHARLSGESIHKLRENTCKTPILNPFAPAMVEFFQPPVELNCVKNKRIFYFKSHVQQINSSYQPMIIAYRKVPPDLRCCYEQLRFSRTYEYKPVNLATDYCHFFSKNKTEVPSDSMYLIVKCWNATSKQREMHRNITDLGLITLVPNHYEILFYVPKPSRERLLRIHRKKKKTVENMDHPPLNVIILGYDQVSRANFIRLMRKSFSYLRNDLDAIDLQGFNKMGDATLNNTLALLTGHDVGSIQENNFFSDKDSFFDECPWIWKNYSENGYITAYADDYVSVFNYRFQGFRKQPTDYYMEPFLQWYHNSQMGRWMKFGTYDCIGNDPALDLIQDHARKMSDAVGTHPYFHFMWISRIHEKPGYAALADESTVETLKYFQSSGVLNRSLVILWSDHGWRVGPILLNPQARLENRLSFAFILVPQWFREKYSIAYENLKENQYRLTSPYDIHATLEDILNPTELMSNEVISTRSVKNGTKGVTLFLPISKARSCADAGIDVEWCACINYEPFSIDSPMNKQLAMYAVDTLNSWLSPYPFCRKYFLDKVIYAEVKKPYFTGGRFRSATLNFRESQQFRITFSVLPKGTGAQFEVTIFTHGEYWQTGGREWISMSSEVFRLNRYFKANCMPVYSLKKICTCQEDEQK